MRTKSTPVRNAGGAQTISDDELIKRIRSRIKYIGSIIKLMRKIRNELDKRIEDAHEKMTELALLRLRIIDRLRD